MKRSGLHLYDAACRTYPPFFAINIILVLILVVMEGT